MFGIFKKKKKKKKLDATVDTAVGLLTIQIALGNADGSHNDKLIDQYGRGYMYGMCDALTQTANINSDKELADVLVFVHIKLFGDKDVREILDLGITQGILAADPAPTITVLKVADVSQADKANRNLPDITFNATLAGAIHKVTVRGTVSV